MTAQNCRSYLLITACHLSFLYYWNLGLQPVVPFLCILLRLESIALVFDTLRKPCDPSQNPSEPFLNIGGTQPPSPMHYNPTPVCWHRLLCQRQISDSGFI